jgi:RNase adaptor protein for sRNA GlmZ degradation
VCGALMRLHHTAMHTAGGRKRRVHPLKEENNGVTMLQRAMELKKKNLEPLKGNAFASLHTDNLCRIASDVSLKLGTTSAEMDFILKILVEDDSKKFENFVRES